MNAFGNNCILSNLFFQVPLEGFKALQGISGPQRFQVHKAYGAPDRLPSAHTWLVICCVYCPSISIWLLHITLLHVEFQPF